MDSKDVHIGECAKRLGVSSHYLRLLEYEGRIPQARRDFNGRVYSEFDVALLWSMGVGKRPRRLRRAEEILGVGG